MMIGQKKYMALKKARFFTHTLLCAGLLCMASCAGNSPPSTHTESAMPATTSAMPSVLSPEITTPVASGQPSTMQARPTGSARSYLIGVDDLLRVTVFGIEELNLSVRVNAQGQIAMPLIGSVPAAGLTAEALAEDIAARLAKDYLQNPQVTVFIEEFTSQKVTVVGAVKNPGVFPVKGQTTLLQVVAAAGQPTTIAKRGVIKVLRHQPDGRHKIFEYDLDAIIEGRVQDPEVFGEDVVHVETSNVKRTAKEILEFVKPFWFLGRGF